MPFAADLAEQMEPWLNDSRLPAEHQGDLQLYLNAIGQMFDPLANIIEGTDVDPGWGAILNPQTFPTGTYNLGFLAQFLGVPLPSNASISQDLALITAETGLYVGSKDAILSAVQLNLLPGATSPTFTKGQMPNGSSNPWWFTITYRLTDVPGTVSTTGNVTSGSPVVTGIASTSGFQAGAPIAGVGIPGQTVIQSVNSSSQITMTNDASETATADPLAVGTLSALTSIKNSIAKVQQAGTLCGLVWTVGYTWAQQTREWEADTRTWSQAQTEL